jgi:hypothetical protein
MPHDLGDDETVAGRQITLQGIQQFFLGDHGKFVLPRKACIS